jgi:hypothetical protein
VIGADASLAAVSGVSRLRPNPNSRGNSIGWSQMHFAIDRKEDEMMWTYDVRPVEALLILRPPISHVRSIRDENRANKMNWIGASEIGDSVASTRPNTSSPDQA